MEISAFSSISQTGRRPEIGGGKNQDFLDQLLESMGLDLQDYLNDDGTLDVATLQEELGGQGGFGPPIGGGFGGGFGGGPPDFNSQAFQDNFVDQFGEDALELIQNDDGSVDPAALREFMQDQGFGPPMGGGGPPPFISNMMQGGMQGGELGNDTLATLLEMLSTNSDESDEENNSSPFNIPNGA